MEKMRDPPFAEQALNLIKTRGLLNSMSELEKMKAYSEWLEGLRAKPYFSLGFSFAGVAVRIPGLPEPGADAAAPVLLARPGDGGPGRPQTVTPLSFANGFLDFSQKRGACLEPPTTPIASEAGGWERAVSTAFPKLLTLGGGGGRAPVAGKTRRGARPQQAAHGNGSGGRSDKERETTAVLPVL